MFYLYLFFYRTTFLFFECLSSYLFSLWVLLPPLYYLHSSLSFLSTYLSRNFFIPLYHLYHFSLTSFSSTQLYLPYPIPPPLPLLVPLSLYSSPPIVSLTTPSLPSLSLPHFLSPKGIEEMRVIRLPYAGLAPPNFNNSDPTQKGTTDFTSHTAACMQVGTYTISLLSVYITILSLFLCYLYLRFNFCTYFSTFFSPNLLSLSCLRSLTHSTLLSFIFDSPTVYHSLLIHYFTALLLSPSFFLSFFLFYSLCFYYSR